MAEEQKAVGLGEVHRHSSTDEKWKNCQPTVWTSVYVIPGISTFGNMEVWRGLAWDSLLHDINPSQFPDKTRDQKMKAMTSIFVVGKSGFPDSYPTPHPSTLSPLFTGKGAQGMVSPPPPPFTEVVLLGNNPQTVLYSCSLWTPSRRQDPRSQELKEKCNHLHVLLCLINFRQILQCFTGSWTVLQHPAISLKWICSIQEDGMRTTLIWGCRKTSKTIDWTGRELWDHPIQMPCATEEKTGSRRGHGLSYLT